MGTWVAWVKFLRELRGLRGSKYVLCGSTFYVSHNFLCWFRGSNIFLCKSLCGCKMFAWVSFYLLDEIILQY